jgi:mRNA-degrading endonuclease RelE of RelBE toxin-antitoxin system
LWRSKPSNRFVRRYDDLSDEMAKRADEAIQIILSHQRPERLGVVKTASRKGMFAYELGNSCRILYYPIYESKTVEFFRICSHGEVYDR